MGALVLSTDDPTIVNLDTLDNGQRQFTPVVQSASGGGNTAVTTPVAFPASPYTFLQTDQILDVDPSGGAIQINLPNPSLKNGFLVADVTGFAATNAITLHRFGTETIRGVPADFACQINFGAWYVWSDGTNWNISGTA
jgi:hypothetical protein